MKLDLNFQTEILIFDFSTDMGRRIGTLVRLMLLLENPQFLPKNYETLSK